MKNNKAPVILIHGMWSTPDMMDELRATFEERGHPVLSPRLPYHKAKNQLTEDELTALGSTSIQEYILSLESDVVEFLQDKGDQKPIVLGHSMGALLAQLLANRIQCAQLIILSSAAPAGFNSLSWTAIRTAGHNLIKFPLWRSTTKLLLKNIQYGIANSQSADIHKELIQNATYDSGLVSMQISMWFLYRKPPTKVHFEKAQCPVLVIGGSEDKITPLKLQKRIAKKYGEKSSIKIIEGACHYTVGGTYFPAIREHIVSWVEQHTASSLKRLSENTAPANTSPINAQSAA